MRQQPGRRRAGGAVGLLVDRRAEAIEERVARVDALHEAHVAEIALRHDRLRAVLGDDLAPAAADLGDRLVPGDALEVVAAVGAEPLGPTRRRGYIRRSGLWWWSWKSLSFTHSVPRVIGCSLLPLHVDELAVVDLVDHGARVGAVVRTGAEEGLVRLSCSFIGVLPVGCLAPKLLYGLQLRPVRQSDPAEGGAQGESVYGRHVRRWSTDVLVDVHGAAAILDAVHAG